MPLLWAFLLLCSSRLAVWSLYLYSLTGLPNGHLNIRAWSSVKSPWAPKVTLPSLAGSTPHSFVLGAPPYSQECPAPSGRYSRCLETGLWWSGPQGVCYPSPLRISYMFNLHLPSPVVAVHAPNLEAGSESWVLRYVSAASVLPSRSWWR